MTNLTRNDRVMYCSYYQAMVDRTNAWFVVAILRSFDHMAFDRTLDVATSLFEFFVPPAREDQFVSLMEHLQEKGYVSDVKKLPNRLLDPAEKV